MEKNKPLLFIKTVSDGVLDNNQIIYDTRKPKKDIIATEIVLNKVRNIFTHYPKGTLLKLIILGKEVIEDVKDFNHEELVLANNQTVPINQISDVFLVKI